MKIMAMHSVRRRVEGGVKQPFKPKHLKITSNSMNHKIKIYIFSSVSRLGK